MARSPAPKWEEDPPTPVEVEIERKRGRCFWLSAFAIVMLIWLGYWRFFSQIPVDYVEIEDHFKYGSIGTEPDNGIPYWIWKVLPEMFPEHLPQSGVKGYGALGFIQEPGRDTPIGFSKRTTTAGIELVSLNCAVCHTATVRESPQSEPRVILAMPAHQLNLLDYFQFLADCAADPRFTVDNVMAEISARTKLGPVERLAYRTVAIPRVRERLMLNLPTLEALQRHPSGTGRIDTFTPYKLVQFRYGDPDVMVPGNTDFPAIWNQRLREGMQLHWDGNNTSVRERNISAGIGAGATPTSIDLPRLKRIEDWLLDLKPEKWPTNWKYDADKARNGEVHYLKYCADCHGVAAENYQGHRVGTVVPIDRIQTDRNRLDSYTLEFAWSQYSLGVGQDWRFSHFRKTNGYANHPMDGIWLRGPYLHNGSVPTLRDLLEAPEKRPKTFYRGDDVFDQDKVGFASDQAERGGRKFQQFDTTKLGNSNSGHWGPAYGSTLTDAQKDELVEYLKTL